jgi:thiosulfate/3-mercaptopyruvate sulfurtransferase
MKQRNLCALLIVTLISCMPAMTFAQRDHDPHMQPQLLVSADWLAAQMHHPDNLVIVHVGSTRAIYDSGHIPGAHFLLLSQIAFTQNGVLNEIAPMQQLKAAFESLGIGDKSRVVLYSDSQGELAARTWFTLKYLGHGNDAALLDGGLEQWKAEGREVITEVPGVEFATFTPRLDPTVIVHLPQVLDASWEVVNVRDANVALVDSRPAGEYTGDTPTAGVPRAGHIPGGINLFWPALTVSATDPRFLSQHELRTTLESAGVTPDKRVIVYCRSGMRATPVYFVLSYLGYDVAVYDGSFSQYSSTANTPVVTGTSAF